MAWMRSGEECSGFLCYWRTIACRALWRYAWTKTFVGLGIGAGLLFFLLGCYIHWSLEHDWGEVREEIDIYLEYGLGAGAIVVASAFIAGFLLEPPNMHRQEIAVVKRLRRNLADKRQELSRIQDLRPLLVVSFEPERDILDNEVVSVLPDESHVFAKTRTAFVVVENKGEVAAENVKVTIEEMKVSANATRDAKRIAKMFHSHVLRSSRESSEDPRIGYSLNPNPDSLQILFCDWAGIIDRNDLLWFSAPQSDKAPNGYNTIDRTKCLVTVGVSASHCRGASLTLEVGLSSRRGFKIRDVTPASPSLASHTPDSPTRPTA